MPQGFIANGDIPPMRFVKYDTVDGRVLQCGAGDRPIGVSQKSTRRAEYVAADGLAAKAGEPILVFDLGEECALELGGTVTPQARLKSDASGKGVATTTDKDQYGALALMNGVAGEIINVKVDYGEASV
jgi:hypothetical protein